MKKVNVIKKIEQKIRVNIRKIASCDKGDNRPIKVIENSIIFPVKKGNLSYYTNKKGKVVSRNYSYDLIYHPSTRRVEVGKLWLQYLLDYKNFITI